MRKFIFTLLSILTIAELGMTSSQAQASHAQTRWGKRDRHRSMLIGKPNRAHLRRPKQVHLGSVVSINKKWIPESFSAQTCNSNAIDLIKSEIRQSRGYEILKSIPLNERESFLRSSRFPQKLPKRFIDSMVNMASVSLGFEEDLAQCLFHTEAELSSIVTTLYVPNQSQPLTDDNSVVANKAANDGSNFFGLGQMGHSATKRVFEVLNCDTYIGIEAYREILEELRFTQDHVGQKWIPQSKSQAPSTIKIDLLNPFINIPFSLSYLKVEAGRERKVLSQNARLVAYKSLGEKIGNSQILSAYKPRNLSDYVISTNQCRQEFTTMREQYKKSKGVLVKASLERSHIQHSTGTPSEVSSREAPYDNLDVDFPTSS